MDVDIGVNYGVALLWSESKSIPYTERGEIPSRELEGLKDFSLLPKTIDFLSGAGLHLLFSPKGNPPGSHICGSSCTSHRLGGRVPRKLSARKVVHPITIPALGGVPSEFPWISVKPLGFRPTLALP